MMKICLNLSRVGKNGTGVMEFSKKFILCLEKNKIDYNCIIPKGASLAGLITDKSKLIYTPDLITPTTKKSYLRPLLWALYSLFFFPEKKKLLISLSFHFIPFVKNQIITIHDFRGYFYPDGVLQKIYVQKILPVICKKLTAVFTVSETTKFYIHQYYKIPVNKIFVIPNVVDTSQYYPNYGKLKNDQYILMVGATWKHKNLEEVIENRSAWITKYRLKVVCGTSQYITQMIAKIKELGISDKVDFYYHVPATELRELYQNAKCLVYPSFMEGFGIPPIEAMACGIPTIVSEIPIFREVYGDAARYIKLGDKDDWKSAFSDLENIDYISALIEKGFTKSKVYNLEKMEKEINKALNSLSN